MPKNRRIDSKRNEKFIGTSYDEGNQTIPKGADYNGRVWKNSKGVVVGRSDQEDSRVIAHKSTGEDAPMDFTKIAKVKRLMTLNKPPKKAKVTTGMKVTAGAKAGKAYMDLPVTKEYRIGDANTGIMANNNKVVVGRAGGKGKIIPYKSTGESGPVDFTKAAKAKRLNRRS